MAAQIESDIGRRGWKAGTHLGTEAELMARYGVSRETLRKAIRQIEHHGVAAMRRGGGGGGGGLVVTEAAPAAAIRAVAGYLELSDVGWPEILEARALIDLRAVELATARIDEVGIDKLRALAGQLDQASVDAHDIARRHLALPAAIAEASGNPVLMLFTEALNSFTLDILPSELGSAQARVAQARRTNALLRDLVEAIVAGDALAAQQAARTFADTGMRLASLLERARHSALPELDHPRALRGAASESLQKRPQRLALRLARETALRGWPIGEPLGAEAELIERHGVSRAVFREAVRLLELHGVVYTQRGRGGGLRVGQPDPAYAVASAVRYLRRVGLEANAYLDVRRALQLGAAQLAAQRATADGLARLETAATVEDFHHRLCELTGNRALALLTRIAFAVPARSEPAAQARLQPPTAGQLPSLLAALRAGDAARARRYMLEHISATQ
ncbi:MAG TPA: FCD domain-containing protein [Burkholderiaceae bacterium]|nr:FCD domain-containing protein [Burkholderiaceae bacterium]